VLTGAFSIRLRGALIEPAHRKPQQIAAALRLQLVLQVGAVGGNGFDTEVELFADLAGG